jgi:hypothetical protein
MYDSFETETDFDASFGSFWMAGTKTFSAQVL